MSRKINPLGFRVGVTKPWKSLWFAEGGLYGNYLVEDEKIRKYINGSLRNAGID